jgi:hypothetical protein
VANSNCINDILLIEEDDITEHWKIHYSKYIEMHIQHESETMNTISKIDNSTHINYSAVEILNWCHYNVG